LRIDFFAVGQGDATLIVSPNGKTVLIDGGPRTSHDVLVAQIKRRTAGPLDLILLTHRHADHLGGLAAVIDAVGARLFMDAPFPHPSPAYASLLRLIEARQIPVRQAVAGRKVDLGGGASLELLGPPNPPLRGTRSDVNANSVVSRIAYGKIGVLLAADAEAPTESWLLASGMSLAAGVLKVAHHGSKHSSAAAFLRAVSPQIAIVSVGADNRYGHPAAPTIDRLAAAGARIYRTDRDGDITVETDGQRIDLRTARSHHVGVGMRQSAVQP
jgi:beta-lactamase superfamily II metal-dependent hydrolase